MNITKTLSADNPVALKTFDVCGVRVSAVNLAIAADTISQWIRARFCTFVCIAPAATIVSSQEDPEYHDVVNQAGMVTPDGMPLVWLAKMSGCRWVERSYGPDLVDYLCRMSETTGFRHFFYGGDEETNTRLVSELKRKYPKLPIVGTHAPGIIPLHGAEDASVIERINFLNPDIVWVGLGSPKQDFWMSEHRSRLTAPVIVGVGAAFDFLSGAKKQAPRWMQRSGLEWLFRLGCEPRRLWKRYIVGNTKFVLFIARDLFRKRISTQAKT